MKEPAAATPVHIYLPSFAGGGAERVFVRLANHFVAAGRPVVIIVNRTTGPLRELLSEKVTVVDLGAAHGRGALPRLVRYLRSARPRVLLSAMMGPNVVAILACALARSPTRLIASERNHVSARLRQWPMRRRWTYRLLLRLLYARAHYLTAVTEGVAADLAEVTGIPRDRIVVVHNPRPDDEEVNSGRSAAPPHPWFAEGTPVLLAIGRLVPHKGFRVLLEALALVRAERDVRLIILGEGPDEAHLRALAGRLGIAASVDLPGFVPNRLDYLVRSGLYIMASDVEGFPNSLLEALACDIRVVSTDCAGGGARTILEPSRSDAIVRTGDARALAAAIGRELDRAVAPGDMAAIAERFSMDRTASRFLELCDMVA